MSSGDSLLQQASKKESTSKSSGLSSFFGGGNSTSKLEEAREIYIQAANAFKAEKRFKESGDAFIRAGECALKIDEKYDASNDFWSVASLVFLERLC